MAPRQTGFFPRPPIATSLRPPPITLRLPSREIENLFEASGEFRRAIGNPAAMAPPPLPPAAEKATEATAAAAPQPAAEGQRTLPTPFLTKTYQLVDDPAVDDMISWNEDGSTFVVWRPAEFARDLLPKYFKHNNFSSFVRQLNTYGFRKIVPDRWEFANDCFRRGEKRLLCDIHRRKINPAAPPLAAPIPVVVPIDQAGSPANSGEEQVLSSNSSPGTQPPPPSAATGTSGSPELMEENEMLRKENARLSRELAQMKNLCSHIATLISKHGDEGSGGGGGEGNAAAVGALPSMVLELMPGGRMEEGEEDVDVEDAEAETAMEEDEAVKAEEATSGASPPPPPPGESPRLFGVTIGGKRDRDEDKGEAPTPEVKPEPREGSSPERHQRSWVVYCPRPIRRVCNGSEAAAEGDGART